ncbi:uncharacterized protein PAC_13567 [Phialocephala subalpina]|uniref:Macro domain-containing protein n=1 Tax=Phialocephala subalpina TaxID=576137 RepID=A0A1L7XF51_9HELO|nr:uncharacterized protein PAC_13567 [Phialocephala subalpina]
MPPKEPPKTMDELSGLIQTHYRGVRVQVLRGDITNIVAHVIVNAASTGLRGGGGIDGNIHLAAGPGLREELRQLYPNGGEVGKAYTTGSHNMQPRVRAIVHAIGPNYKGTTTDAQKEAKMVQLRSAYLNSLDAASNCKFMNNLTVVLPCISTGIFGYPMEDAAKLALQTIHDWIETHPNPAKFERIVVLLFGNKDPNEPSYKKAFPIIFSGENNNGGDGDVEMGGGMASPNLFVGEDSDGEVQMFWVWDNDEAGDGDDEGNGGKGGGGSGGGLSVQQTAGGRVVCERGEEGEEDSESGAAPGGGTGGDPPSDDGGDGPDSDDSGSSRNSGDDSDESTEDEVPQQRKRAAGKKAASGEATGSASGSGAQGGGGQNDDVDQTSPGSSRFDRSSSEDYVSPQEETNSDTDPDPESSSSESSSQDSEGDEDPVPGVSYICGKTAKTTKRPCRRPFIYTATQRYWGCVDHRNTPP